MRDPLASLRFEEEDFEWATAQLKDIADEFAEGRLVSTLEGGYDLKALGNSVQACVGADERLYAKLIQATGCRKPPQS